MPDAGSFESCASCGAALRGPYCHACGERRREPGDLSLRAFLADAVRAVTDADSRLWRTLRVLATDPGRLTREWTAGRRRPWITPLRLFLLVNVVYFLSQSLTGFNTFTTPLEVHLEGMPHAALARSLVRDRMADREEDYNVFRARFDAASATQAKTLVIAIVPFFALLVAALERRRNRPPAVHLVFALHAVSFLMLMAAVLDPLVRGVAWIEPAIVNEAGLAGTYGAVFGVHLFLAFRGAGPHGVPAAAARTIVGLAGMIVLLYLYRLFLFFTVFFTL